MTKLQASPGSSDSKRAELTSDLVRDLRNRQFARVLNTPRPTIDELEAILKREDLSVEIRPNGEVHAVPDSDAEVVRALCDHYLNSPMSDPNEKQKCPTCDGKRTVDYRIPSLAMPGDPCPDCTPRADGSAAEVKMAEIATRAEIGSLHSTGPEIHAELVADRRALLSRVAELERVLEQLKPHLSVALQSLSFHVAMAAHGRLESAFDAERNAAIEAIRPYTKYAALSKGSQP